MSEEVKQLSGEEAAEFASDGPAGDLSDDQLAAALRGESPPEAEAPEEEAQPESPFDGEEEEVEAKDDSVEPEPDQPSEEAEAETPPEEDSQLSEIQLQMQEMEARVKQWEQIAGRATGNEGYLKQKIKELESKLSEQDSGYQEPSSESPIQPDDSLRTWVIADAVTRAGQLFFQAHQEQDDPEIMQSMVSELQSNPELLSESRSATDPHIAHQSALQDLERLYWRKKQERISATRQEMEKRRVDQASDLKKRKKAAAVQTNTAGVKGPKSRSKTVKQLSDDELAAAIRARG